MPLFSSTNHLKGARALRFTKMEGAGNDYIYLNCLEGAPEGLSELAVCLSRRHLGVGADGLICVKPGRAGDFSMEMYNADGSRGAMCGNGIRCLGKYVYDRGLTRKTCLTIETDAGPRALELHVAGGAVDQVTVDMGLARFGPRVEAEAEGENFSIWQVSMGNPHAVIFYPRPEAVDLARLGPALENHPALLERSNVEFAAAEKGGLTVRVWERGSGITLACGTGACACFAAARRQGLCGDRAPVRLPGGVLEVEARGENLFLTGPVRQVFEGDWEPSGKFRLTRTDES